MPVSEEPSPDKAMYDTLDPTLVAPLSGLESGDEVAPAPTETEIPRFDDRYRDDLNGLLFLGALKKSFEWMGHRFVIRTLNVGEYAEIAVAAGRYRDTDFAAKAYQAATVAACIISVDGKDLPVMPISNGENDTNIAARFEYVMYRWFAPTIDYVFTQFYELESTVRELIDELGKPSG